jgi:hypothetical protein
MSIVNFTIIQNYSSTVINNILTDSSKNDHISIKPLIYAQSDHNTQLIFTKNVESHSNYLQETNQTP